MTEKTLGILGLENKHFDWPGALLAPDTFEFPVKLLTVPGAWARNLIDSDRSVKDAYINCARQLEREGVAAIIAHCGFSALFQEEVSSAVSVPVALSSLQLVPLAASTLPPGRKVGILTYDSRKLTEHHFSAAGWSSEDVPVAIAGIEGSESWRKLDEPVPTIPRPSLISDIETAVTSLLKADPAVATLVFECAAFPPAAEPVRRRTGLPVADYVSLARMLVEISPSRGVT